MAKTVQKSSLFTKMAEKAARAHEAHKNDEADVGNPSVPPGIEGGIAQLVECKFDVFKEGANKGQPYFLASAVIVEPEYHDGKKVAGLRTQIGPEPICDTPKAMGQRKTFDDHWAWMLNQMRILGVDVSKTKPEQVESLAAALKEAQPYTYFRTWQGKATKEFPNPKVNHQWNGLADYSANGQAIDAGVEDATDQVDEPVTEDAPEADAPAGDTTEITDDMTVEQLVELANADNADAQNKLNDLAEELGVLEAAQTADNWEACGEIITAAQEEAANAAGEAEPADAEAPWEPKKDEVYNYKPRDKAGKVLMNTKTRKQLPAVNVEVTGVDKKTKTVTLKNLEDGKTKYTGVKWDWLESA